MATFKVDLDGRVTPCRWVRFCRRAVATLDLMGFDAQAASIDVRRSPSGGIHARIHVAADVPDVVIIGAQAILGSDPKREALNMARAMRGEPANVLHTQRNGQQWGEPWPAGVLTFKRLQREAAA